MIGSVPEYVRGGSSRGGAEIPCVSALRGSFRAETSVPVLVVKIGRYPLHHGGLGVIRSLGRLGVPVYAITENRFTPAAVSRHLRASFVWPTTGLEDTSTLVEGMLCIGRQIGQRAVVVPTDDEAAVFLSEQASPLAAHFLHAVPSAPGLSRRLADKHELHQLCLQYGVSTVDETDVHSLAEVEHVARTTRFPMVAKNREAYVRLRARSVPSTTLLRGPDDLRRLARSWPEDPGVILQEYLPEEHSEDWIVHGYFGADSIPRVLFTGIKVRSWPPHAGLTACAFVARNPELAAQTSRLCKQIGYSGVVDLDWRLDRRDGRYKLLDFNPRVGAQFRLFENEREIDVVRAQYLDLTGQEVPVGEQVEGRRFVLEHVDPLARWSYRQRDCSPSPRPPRDAGTEYAWFAGDDLKPYLAMLAYAARGGTRRVFHASRHRIAGREEPT
jgi:D-aspartate ligase